MRTFALVLLIGLLCGPAFAVDGQALQLFLQKETAGFNGRVEVTVGQPDPRIQLTPCARMEPFVPPGARLWGRAMLGVRCVEGSTWTTYVPIHIKVFAPALVATRGLAAGQELGPDDVRVDEVELTREAPGILNDPAQLRDKVMGRALYAGQALRAEHLRARQVVTAGELVKLTYMGAGFSVSAEARALSPATAGQMVRVQTESGKILMGVAKPGRLVEIRG